MMRNSPMGLAAVVATVTMVGSLLAAEPGGQPTMKARLRAHRVEAAKQRKALALKSWLLTPGGPPGLRREFKEARMLIGRAAEDKDAEGILFGANHDLFLLADGTVAHESDEEWNDLQLQDLLGQDRPQIVSSFKHALDELRAGKPLTWVEPDE